MIQDQKPTAQGTRFYTYTPSGALQGEYLPNGTLQQEIIWLGDIPITVLQARTGQNGQGGWDLYYIHADHLNTPRAITRPSDNLPVWIWASDAATNADGLDPFGAALPNDNPSGLGSFTFNLRFPGQYFDIESHLHYNHFRYYDPLTGRYISSDPIGHRGGISTYAYVRNNPLKYFDTNGLQAAAPPIDIPMPRPFPLPGFGGLGGMLGSCIRGISPILMALMPSDSLSECQDDPNGEKSQCEEPDCKKASSFQLRQAGIDDEHGFKEDYVGKKGVSRYDICACKDGSILIKQVGGCGRPGPYIPTHPRWK